VLAGNAIGVGYRASDGKEIKRLIRKRGEAREVAKLTSDGEEDAC
jgi:hypothetical protein